MMLGGGLMMGLGTLVLLAIIAIPIVLVFAVTGGATSIMQRRREPPAVYEQPVNTTSNQAVRPEPTGAASARNCAHCGAGLQADWTHCPQCGAPVS